MQLIYFYYNRNKIIQFSSLSEYVSVSIFTLII